MKKFLIAVLVVILTLIMSIVCIAAEITIDDDATINTIEPTSSTLYIPGYIDEKNVVFNINATKVTIGDKTIDFKSGDSVDISAGKKTGQDDTVYYTVKFLVDNKTKTYKIYLLSDIPSIYINTSTGISWSKDSIDKNTKISIVDSNGKVVYDDFSNETTSELKGRGNMSWSYVKKPFQFKLSKKTNLFNMGKAKTWVLLANYIDSSFIRNSLAFKVADTIGLDYTCKSQHVNLYIDGVYNGLYLLCEKVQINDKRVDITDLEEITETLNEGVDFSKLSVVKVTSGDFINTSNISSYSYCKGIKDPEDITGGYLIELDNLWNSGDPCKFTTGAGNTYVLKSPEYASKAQVEYIAGLVSDMEEAIYSSTGYNTLGIHYSDYCDVESLLKVYVVNELTKNWDAYVGSTFFYKDADKNGVVSKIYAGPVWDYDNAYANLDRTVKNDKGETIDFGNDPAAIWATGATGMSYNSYFGRYLTMHKELWNQLCAIFDTAIKASDDFVSEGGFVDQLVSSIELSAKADRVLWTATRQSAFKQYKTFNNGPQSAIGALKQFISDRDAAMNEYFKANVDVPDETSQNSTTAVEITTSTTIIEETTAIDSTTITSTSIDETTSKGQSGGCKSVISASIIIPIISLACLINIKKKD